MWSKAIIALALLTAAVSIGEVVRIEAKAMLAQRLIERAWARSLETGELFTPWHWADTWPVARLSSERLPRDLYVLAGANGGSLAFGPGHIDATALPGAAGTSVVAGHRDTHFRFLERVEAGEWLDIQGRDGDWHRYQVAERRVVDTTQHPVWSVNPTRDEMHLITCYPFDAVAPGGPLRLVVIAERVE